MSSSIKYYTSKDGKFKVPVPIITYQTDTSISLNVLQDPQIELDSVATPPKPNPADVGPSS